MKRKPTRLFTLGPEGTFSDQATRLLREKLGDPELPIDYTRTIPEVLVRTEADGRALGIFPIENSVSGTISQAQDSMVNHRLTVLWEIKLAVRFSLIANVPLPEVELYHAHPQAFDQCAEYLALNLPQARVLFSNSNAESGLKFLAHGESTRAAAIVPIEFDADHPDLVVAEDIQDYPNNTTRFLVARRSETGEQYDFSGGKCSLLIEPNEDRPGLLHELLLIFHNHQVNLCRLESRPAKTTPWAYVFYMDFNNGPGSQACLEELRKTSNRITLLGSYKTLE